MLHPIDISIIVAFFVLSAAIALRYRKQAGKDLNSFFLGGRNLPWYIAGISMVATTFAADTPLAVTELVVKNGISGNWLWWCFLAGGMFTTFFFARLWRKAEVLTEAELIELRYSGKAAAWLRGFKAVYLGLFMNVLIIGWVNLALMAILKVFFDLPDATVFWLTALAMLIAAAYSAISGLLGVAVTDAVQFIIAMTGTVILAVIVVNSEKIGGISGLKAQLPDGTLNFLPSIGTQDINGNTLAIGFGSFFAYIGIQWWASWYPGAEPGGGGYVAQRMMSTRSEKDAVYATLFFQIAHYCLRPWPWILVGLSCIVLYPHLTGADIKNGYVMAMKDYLPVGLKGLLLVAFFAAYLSTISTQLNWGASYLVNDFYKRFIKPEATDRKLIAVSRITTMLIMSIALVATTFMESISGVWSFIIECGAGLGMVLILRWFWWRINAWSEITATVAPFIGFAVSRFVFNLEFPDSFFATVGFTTASWLLITFITKPTESSQLQFFYNRVQPGGMWPARFGIHNGPKNEFTYLLLAWLISILMTYSILFLIGKFILAEYEHAILATFSALSSFIALKWLLKKTAIFN
jgi:solute:Na+ symporter, SSS family